MALKPMTRYSRFIQGVTVNWIGKLGVLLTTSSFITFTFLEILRLTGIFTNAYIGLITYLLFPTLFVIGLILIPIAWVRYRRERDKSTPELLQEAFIPDDVRPRMLGSRLFLYIGGLTLINVLFMVGASFRMLHFMDEPVFCGTACHTVMNPEWVTYQASPHARVHCVECHVGEGVQSLINSKLNGIRQMYLAAFNLYNRPIPTPVHQLRPARETCEKCHWPEKFYGTRMQTRISYQLDSLSTPRYTTLNLKIESRSAQGKGKSGIHWHIGQHAKVQYTSVKDERLQMIRVEVEHANGQSKTYQNQNFEKHEQEEPFRTMDCIDCHNRATHIYEDPERAVDERIAEGLISRNLPFIKRVALEAIYPIYPDVDAAKEHIRRRIEGFYRRLDTPVSSAKLDSAIIVLQSLYERNIHPHMRITWNTYPSLIGHRHNTAGCFRCHNPNLVDKQGNHISNDCTLCHSIIADQDAKPYRYLSPPDTADTEYPMHRYLYEDILQSVPE